MRTFLRGKVTLLFLTLGLLLAVPAVALADIIVSPDADIVAPGNQGSSAFPIDLGSVKGGGTLTKQVSFQLQCNGNNHVDNGQTVTVNFATHTLSSGSVSATNATIGPIPTTWPDDVTGGGSTNCPTPAPTPIEDNGNSTVTVTAPTTEGTYNFSAIWNNNNMTPSGSDDSSDVTGTTEVFFRFTVDTTAPTVTDVSPSDGATDVPKGSNVEATFSEAMDAITTDGDPSTINGSTFTLTKPDGNDAGTDPDPVAGAVSYDSATKKATLNPTADLDYSTTYTATVTTGAQDVVGNALDQDGAAGTQNAKTWTFTTEPPPNSAPNVGNISGDNSADEGQTKSYSVSATDPDGDALSYAWSITSGSSFAHIDGAANASSASLQFDDGPGTVGLQVVVNDGNDHPVTKNLSISVNNVAPTTTLSAANPTSVNESSTTEHTYSYTISDPGTDTVSSVSTSCGANGEKVANSDSNTDTSGSFKCKFDDGSSTKQSTVSAQATGSDNDPGNTATQTVNIANVAPTVTNVSALVQNVLSGNNVSFTGTATDPSTADTTAGFFWQFSKDGGLTYTPSSLPTTFASNSNQFTTKFDSCGTQSVKAKATDKDGDTSAAVSSGNVNVYTAPFKAPLIDGTVNTVQKGRVIPVKISVGCGTNLLTGLAPRIDLLSGDVSPESESGSTAVTTSVSSADTGQTMREVDGGYIYNLQVPSTAGKYTIRVNPWGVQTSAAAWSASSNYIVLDVRSK